MLLFIRTHTADVILSDTLGKDSLLFPCCNMLVFSYIPCLSGQRKQVQQVRERGCQKRGRSVAFDFSSRVEAAVKLKDKDFHC